MNEALQRLEREIASAQREKAVLLKIIHGYGSSGVGGDIRIAVQKRLHEFAEGGQIRGCIFGEDWAKGDEATWKLLQERPELKNDPHLGAPQSRNQYCCVVNKPKFGVAATKINHRG